MPNWVTTEIKIRGKAEDLAAFVKKHIVTQKYKNGGKEDILDFETVIPSPKTIDECPRDCIADENSHIVVVDEYFNGDYSRPEPKAICDEIEMQYLYKGDDEDEDEEEGGVC